MSLLRATNHRRRSQSASTASSPSHRHFADDSWRSATKRSQPHHPCNSVSPDLHSPYRWNVEDPRSKRRRRDYSPSSDSMDETVFSHSPHTTRPTFATTSAEFHLFPNRERNNNRIRRASHNPSSQPDFSPSQDLTNQADLTGLRAAAFWELHRSVADNGEGFLLRPTVLMRTTTTSRSFLERYQAFSQTPRELCSSVTGLPGLCSAAANVVRRLRLLQYTRQTTKQNLAWQINSPTAGLRSQPFTPALSFTTSSNSSSIASLPHLPPPTLGLFPHMMSSRPLTLPASRSEKALAALSLAMANGAGSIHDYDALGTVQPVSAIEECQVGEMWD
ncbi:hypothetical protein EDD18DRAFT_1120808 [Armillaria luteobubalina]|uniref:Uncharacterized protein n=1 Tax=Armillaria luteobubalina TaxID=153913 RepID=A0AA39QMS9_9AGAR|nr:hypothetical protein EDD18DRAFT_1120808 [Armillaria luteobubalina]